MEACTLLTHKGGAVSTMPDLDSIPRSWYSSKESFLDDMLDFIYGKFLDIFQLVCGQG